MRFLSIIFIVVFIGGFVMFKSLTPTYCTHIENEDSIFVLAGDSRRIPFALNVQHNHPLTKLYIIGAGTDFKYDNRNIISESKSKTTHQNAIAIKKIVNDNNLSQIVLITTADHYLRAKYLVKKQIPNVKINACTVPLHKIPTDKRLMRWGMEYLKYIGTMIGIRERV